MKLNVNCDHDCTLINLSYCVHIIYYAFCMHDDINIYKHNRPIHGQVASSNFIKIILESVYDRYECNTRVQY